MSTRLLTLGGARVLLWQGAPLTREQDANDIIGATWGQEIDWIALPVERLADDFFRLSSGLAGAVLQKFTNYSHRVAIVGDISARVAGSEALAAFVRESNRGRSVWFVADEAELAARLGSQR